MITFKKLTLKLKAGLVLINHSHAILDQEIQNNGGCLEAAGPDRDRFLQPRKYQKYPHQSWLGSWLWALIVKIQGYCYLSTGYREYLQKLDSLDTWCLTEQTNVLRSNTTSNRINHTACQIWPTMLHIGCALFNSSTLKTSSISTNSWGQELFKTLQTSNILLGVQPNFSFIIHVMPTWYFESFWTPHPYDNIINIKVHLCLKIS